jgi:hypothetical protein
MHLRILILGVSLSLAAGASAMPVMAASPSEIINRTPPPPERIEAEPEARKGFVWSPGFWEWRGTGYRWAPGEWVKEKRGHRWQPYGWEERDGRYHFVHGAWQPLVTTAAASQAGSK